MRGERARASHRGSQSYDARRWVAADGDLGRDEGVRGRPEHNQLQLALVQVAARKTPRSSTAQTARGTRASASKRATASRNTSGRRSSTAESTPCTSWICWRNGTRRHSGVAATTDVRMPGGQRPCTSKGNPIRNVSSSPLSAGRCARALMESGLHADGIHAACRRPPPRSERSSGSRPRNVCNARTTRLLRADSEVAVAAFEDRQ